VLLERIVGNLVTNAIRYTRQGGVLIGCRKRFGLVAIQVVDTGVGIPEEQLDIAFEEFVRLTSTEPGEKGLGLGLAIVRRTAVLLNLKVVVRSIPARGSTFEILLPEGDHPPFASAAARGTVVSPLQGSFVLVVDDEVVNLEASAALLQQWGCLVATATNAEDALEEVDRHLRPPDLVIADLQLGTGSDGLVLIQRLRAMLELTIPAVLVTADVTVAHTAVDAVEVLLKPAGADRLLRALQRALSTVTINPTKP
jgi:CheY-like chemotaxis protein